MAILTVVLLIHIFLAQKQLHLLHLEQEKNLRLRFTDVPNGAYYHDAVAWAVEHHITSGTAANSFSPNRTCTREQIVTFLYKAVRSE